MTVIMTMGVIKRMGVNSAINTMATIMTITRSCQQFHRIIQKRDQRGGKTGSSPLKMMKNTGSRGLGDPGLLDAPSTDQENKPKFLYDSHTSRSHTHCCDCTDNDCTY
jgi:hypothetical protein